MRNLNECTAEVFRRSKKRIQQRRENRRRVLAWSLPLCLIVVVCGVALPAGLPFCPDHATRGEPVMPNEQTMGSWVCAYTEAAIQGSGPSPAHDQKVTDKVEVAKIFSAVHALFVGVDGADPSVGQALYGTPQPTAAASQLPGYVITFSAEDGSRAVYHFRNNTVCNANTHASVTLTDTQAAKLKAALGIAE